MAESFIFFLGGLIVGANVMLDNSDYINLIPLFLLMMLARFVSVGFFLPILQKSGYGLTKGEVEFFPFNSVPVPLVLCSCIRRA